jgi:hypothetical protein
MIELFEQEHEFSQADAKRGGWAFIEIMGHRSHYGFVREVQIFGARMCEVLIPWHDKPGFQFSPIYGGSSIFSITPCSKARCITEAPRPSLWRNQLTAGGDHDELERDDGHPGDDVDTDLPPDTER